MIGSWCWNRAAHTAEIERLRKRVVELEDDVMAARLRAAVAEGATEAGWTWEPTQAVPPASIRAEVLKERARADALESRLHLLQTANMRADQPG